MIHIRLFLILLAAFAAATLHAQRSSTSTEVRRVGSEAKTTGSAASGISDRMQLLMAEEVPDDDNAQWMRVVYRTLGADNIKNAALYYPEDVVDGQENLFRILMRLLAAGDIEAYEYLDGREIFGADYRINIADVLDRFHIPYTEGRKTPDGVASFLIEESDVPAAEVQSYYIIERWVFDRRSNRKTTHVEAVCPVLHRVGDFGGEAVRYPMFWVKMSDIHPYLMACDIFVDDDNNAASYTYDDFFRLGLYDGEIYKTRNLRNLSMDRLYPDPDRRKREQASIDSVLENYDRKMWVPTREEVIAAKEERERIQQGDTIAVKRTSDPVRKSSMLSSRAKSATRAKRAGVKEQKTVTRSVRSRK